MFENSSVLARRKNVATEKFMVTFGLQRGRAATASLQSGSLRVKRPYDPEEFSG